MHKLTSLYKRFDDCQLCRLSGNSLRHILGGGKKKSPKVVFVFINPTHTNISSHSNWDGLRFPFIGVTHFWKIFADSGWVAAERVEDIKKHGWNVKTIKNLEDDLSDRGIYITNLVKCTFTHGDYPEKKYFDYHLPLFEEELSVVKAKAIVSFGTLTTNYLTGENLTFKKYFENPQPLVYDHIPVYPCYFPVGRGNPKLARHVLSGLTNLLE